MKVLVIGSGGREHCLSWKIKQSALVDKVFIAPGSAGTALLGENVDIGSSDIKGLLNFAKQNNIELTVVGPEAPLVGGIVDQFNKEGLHIFGPSKELAQLEGSKVFAKKIMKEFNIPTAEAEFFSDSDNAKKYISERSLPLVVKADGLAAGKGVMVCSDKEEAYKAVDTIITEKKFGAAGNKILVEDCLAGEEASILAVSNGEDFLTLIPSQDHKRIYEGDEGPNTGGMGAYAPALIVDEKMLQKIKTKIFSPLIKGLASQGKEFKGVLYGGLMIQNGEPYVLEFNVRFGDPEIQAVLPKLKDDIVDIMLRSVRGESFPARGLDWDRRSCLCTVLASGGYPGKYQKGKRIVGLEDFTNEDDVLVFHAGTKFAESDETSKEIVTAGGRVLNVCGLGRDLKEAQNKVYENIGKIKFDNMYYRKDIGNKAVKTL